MKKTIMFLGVLSLGLAHAQQYDGKVGVNTETPSATLNVKSLTGTTKTTKNFELQNAADKKLVTVLDNGNVGIGKHDPQYILDIASSNGDYHENNIAIRSARVHQGSSGISIYRSTGTVASPEAVKLGDYLSSFNTSAHTGASHKLSASMTTMVTGEIDNNTVPTSMLFTVFGDNTSIHRPQMVIHHTGNVGIGLGTYINNYSGYNYIMPDIPTARLHIKPKHGENPLKLEGLQAATGTNTQNLVVENGVVKVGATTSSTGATQLSGTDNIECKEENRGKMNFKRAEDGKSDVFGVCLKHKNGNYNWAYFVGGGNPTNGSGVFGNGIVD